MKSTVTQFIFRSSRNPDGSQGSAIIFFATEAYRGYEASSNNIESAHAPGDPEADGKSVFAQFLLDFGVGTLTFSEADNILESPDGCSVTFTSVRKLADDESFAGPESAFSDVFN